MAKSSGNVWTLDRLEEEGHHPLDFRYLCLTSRYRRQLRFSPDALAAAGKARSRLAAHLADWGEPALGAASPAAKEWDQRFRDAVLDDLDFPKALAVVWALAGEEAVAAGERAALLRDWDRVLGVGLDAAAGEAATGAAGEDELPPGAADLLDARRASRCPTPVTAPPGACVADESPGGAGVPAVCTVYGSSAAWKSSITWRWRAARAEAANGSPSTRAAMRGASEK